MLLAKKIKLEVTEADAATLEFMQGKCRGLYNWWVMKLRQGERWNFAQPKRTLRESRKHDTELSQVYGKLLAKVFYRLKAAMEAFFRRLKAEEKPGFPRARPRHCFFTLCYPAAYLKVVGKTLMLPTGGGSGHGPKKYPNIVATLTEEPPADFREVAISRDARGSYYASFSYRQEEHSQEPGEVVAFDLGMKTLAVGVNEQGHLYHIGDLSQKQMVIKEHQDRKQERHTPLNRAVFNDWGLSPFMQMLLYKCILAGKEVVKLDERDTSKLCSGCRNLQPMPLHKRTYRCPNCGLVMDRDENSAHNLLARFFARLGPHTDRRSVRCADVFTAIENVDTCEHIEKGRHMCKNTC